jgi:hypothetical protein
MVWMHACICGCVFLYFQIYPSSLPPQRRYVFFCDSYHLCFYARYGAPYLFLLIPIESFPTTRRRQGPSDARAEQIGADQIGADQNRAEQRSDADLLCFAEDSEQEGKPKAKSDRIRKSLFLIPDA